METIDARKSKVNLLKRKVEMSFIQKRQSPKEFVSSSCEGTLQTNSSNFDYNREDDMAKEEFLFFSSTAFPTKGRLETLPLYLQRILISLTFLLLISQPKFCSAQKQTYKSSINPATSIVIPHIKYGQGLNKWSFLSVDRDNHGLHSDLLCPNPMIGVNTGSSGRGGINRGNVATTGSRGWQQQTQYPQTTQSRFPSSQQQLPNEIWAVKSDATVNYLPCSLREHSVPKPPFNANSNNKGSSMGNPGSGGMTRHNNGHFIENRILFINVSLVPFNFLGAVPCSKYIKLTYDEEEGANLKCRNTPHDNKHDNKYHINWPDNRLKRKEHWSLLENLERFLQSEQTLHRQFYFQIYFTSFNGRSKRCTVQQYELDLAYPAGSARFCNLTTQGLEELCGEFHCGDLIFPHFPDPQVHDGNRQRGTGMSEEDDYDDEDDYDEDENSLEHDLRANHPTTIKEDGSRSGQSTMGHTHDTSENFSWSRMLRVDIRLLIFITIVPLVLFGILVFGLELIVYFMCCRKSRQETEEERGSHAILQNSLSVWENVPSRDAQRSVSFSPMTTSIYGERKNMMMDSASLESQPDTPKILKSALKKSGEHASPTSAGHHYFEYDHDMPPSYIETTTR